MSWLHVLFLLVAVVSTAPLRRKESGNLNGRYIVNTGTKQGVPFNDDYASRGHEYFDVWSPEIATHYGEVFWADMGNQPIPDAIVKRFAGKVIAITGYEMDQVMVDPLDQAGVAPEKDVSVPFTWAYNHHYMFWLTGSHSELRKVSMKHGPNTFMTHEEEMKQYKIVDLPSAALRKDTSIPTGTWFSEGNGGESRKSFHGYPNAFAQLVDSPTTWHINPMQVDTRNRDCGATRNDIGNCTQFVPGPEPKQARFGRPAPKGTNYSGILECPCNSRYGGDPLFYPDAKTKIFEHENVAITSAACLSGQRVASAQQCFDAAASLGFNATDFENKTVTLADHPNDCSVVLNGDGTATTFYNTGGKGQCTSGAKRSGQASSRVNVSFSLTLDASDAFERSGSGKFCRNLNSLPLKMFPLMSPLPADAKKAQDACERYCLQESHCWGCTSVECGPEHLLFGRPGEICQWNAVSSCDKEMDSKGPMKGSISKKLESDGLAQITMSGPADVWFGVGLNATRMFDQPYALICSDIGVVERKLGTCGDEGRHCGGTELESTVTVTSNTVANGRRTIVMTRNVRGKTPDHYSFDLTDVGTIHMLTAVGSSQTFGYHKAHGPAQLSLSSPGFPTCICDVGEAALLCDNGGTNCGKFVKDCVPSPAGDLLIQRNPTCNSGTYVGGLSCCGHKRIMLDADQEIRPELLRYHMKIRFWFQEYRPAVGNTPASHYDLDRIYYQTESNAGEYDIPPAFALPGETIPGYAGWPHGVPMPGTTCTGNCPSGDDCECIHTITYHWTVSNIRLIYAGGHCHAPSCISIDLYRNDTGVPQLLCHQATKFGQGHFPEDKFDEAGYITLPPCLWSDDPSEGLEPTQWLPENTPLFSIKKNSNTHQGHYGDMASWQMRGVTFPSPKFDTYV